MHDVFIGIGSNIGDREKWIETGISALNEDAYISIENISPFFENPAVSVYKQPDFINAVLKAKTLYTPHELLDKLEAIENQCGRTAKSQNAPRTIDLDIILYDSVILSDDRLTIPHAMMHTREFVLKPLSQIAPDVLHPILNESVSSLLEQCSLSK